MYFVYFFCYTCKHKLELMKANFSYMYMCCCYKQSGEGMFSTNI